MPYRWCRSPPPPLLASIDQSTALLSRSPGRVWPWLSPGTEHHDRFTADLALGDNPRHRGFATPIGVRAVGSSPADAFLSGCTTARLVAVAGPSVSTAQHPGRGMKPSPTNVGRQPRTHHALRSPPHGAAEPLVGRENAA